MREVSWTKEGTQNVGKLVQFMPLHDGYQFICLYAIVETMDGYVEAIDVEHAELRFVNTEEKIAPRLEWLTHYVTEEDFPVEHLDALCHIVGLFNDCKEAEAEVFAFAAKLWAKYAGPAFPGDEPSYTRRREQ